MTMRRVAASRTLAPWGPAPSLGMAVVEPVERFHDLRWGPARPRGMAEGQAENQSGLPLRRNFRVVSRCLASGFRPCLRDASCRAWRPPRHGRERG